MGSPRSRREPWAVGHLDGSKALQRTVDEEADRWRVEGVTTHVWFELKA
jgi:hypothetical protein